MNDNDKTEMERANKVIELIDKAINQKATNTIDYDYWQSLLFRMTDNRSMTNAEAFAIDKIVGLNLY